MADDELLRMPPHGGLEPVNAAPPKDGTMVCLMVDYSGDGSAPLEDKQIGWTIGYNTLADTGDDEWVIVGWDWCQDRYCHGSGKIIDWRPFPSSDHTLTAQDAARAILSDDIAISHMAQALHDGPLGADDHWFSAARPEGGWCVDAVRVVLRAIAGGK